MSLCRNTLDATPNEVAHWANLADEAGEPWGHGEWAPYIQAVLGALGTDRGYTSRYTLPNCQSEFLYDLIWVRKNEEGRVVDVPLVAEIEWASRNEVWWDFQKLLVARAGVRVMIFTGFRGLSEELYAHVQHYALGGDRYLFAAYHSTPEHYFVVTGVEGME